MLRILYLETFGVGFFILLHKSFEDLHRVYILSSIFCESSALAIVVDVTSCLASIVWSNSTASMKTLLIASQRNTKRLYFHTSTS